MNVKELMEQKKLTKQKLLHKQMMKNLEKANKKTQKQGLSDYINPMEWVSSSYSQFNRELIEKLNENKLKFTDMVEMFPQLHRLTFWDCDWDFAKIRKIVNDVLELHLANYEIRHNGENIEIEGLNDEVYNSTIKIHHTQRKLLVKFLFLCDELMKSYTSRLKFSIDNCRMIYDHKLFVKLSHNSVVDKLTCWNKVNDAIELIQNRIQSKEIYKTTKNIIKKSLN